MPAQEVGSRAVPEVVTTTTDGYNYLQELANVNPYLQSGNAHTPAPVQATTQFLSADVKVPSGNVQADKQLKTSLYIMNEEVDGIRDPFVTTSRPVIITSSSKRRRLEHRVAEVTQAPTTTTVKIPDSMILPYSPKFSLEVGRMIKESNLDYEVGLDDLSNVEMVKKFESFTGLVGQVGRKRFLPSQPISFSSSSNTTYPQKPKTA